MSALDEARASLADVTDWRDVTTDEFASHGATALEGRGVWMWLVVRFAVPDPAGERWGYDGTATRGGTLLHLPRDLAMEAWLRGDVVIRGGRWIS